MEERFLYSVTAVRNVETMYFGKTNQRIRVSRIESEDIMGFLDSLFDFNFDGKADDLEKTVVFTVAATMLEMDEEKKQREADLWNVLNDDDEDY